jgi:hypothetical protein
MSDQIQALAGTHSAQASRLKPKWVFYLLWLMSDALVPPFALFIAIVVPALQSGVYTFFLVPLVAAVAGFTIAIAQALIMRGYLPDEWRWALATWIGPGALLFVAIALPIAIPIMDFPSAGRGEDWFIAATIGWSFIWFANSIAQARVLRRSGYRGGAWFLTSCAAGAIGFTMGAWLGITTGVVNQPNVYYSSSGQAFYSTDYHLAVLPQTWIVGSTAAAVISGGITGAALLLLLRERSKIS